MKVRKMWLESGCRAMLMCCFALAACCLAGCQKATSPEQPASSDKPKVEVISATKDPNSIFTKAGFKDWPKPAAVLALTGEMHGYIEPCGCSDPQFGGIARRASLFNQLREKEWPLAAFDLGGTLKNSRRQSEFKFQALLAALRDMKYSGLQIGVEELRLGAAFLVSQDVPPDDDKPNEGLRILGANIVLFGSADLPIPVRHQVIPVGDIKVGVTGVFGDSMKEKLGTVDAGEVAFTDPVAAIQKALTAIDEQKPELRVLISHGTLEESRKLAEKFPAFNLVISTDIVEEPTTENPEQLGNTLLVKTGHKGKFVAVIGYYPDEPKQKYRFDLVKLDGERFKNDAKMVAHMQFYQDLLKDSKLAEQELPIKHSSGDKFVGAEKCGECHTKALAKWNESKHSHAFESLKTGRLGISRIYDPECICCHTVGWSAPDVLRYDGGFVNAEKTAHLKGVQCENCHGPGSKHIELIEQDKKDEANKLMRVSVDQARKKFLCESCHDLDNSPAFKFDDYWPKIAHPGKD